MKMQSSFWSTKTDVAEWLCLNEHLHDQLQVSITKKLRIICH